jgi:SNF2 family DNA or RNA helicase
MDHLKKVEWEVLIVDERRTQRVQKSCQKFYRIFSQIRSIFRLLLLSEPLKSNVEELVQFVNFLEPRKSVLPHGDESIQVAELRRRLAGRVLEYIPKNRLTEYWVPVEMTPTHLDQYYHILVNHYPTLSRNHRDHQIQEVVTKLRQSCNHPFLADPSFEQRTGQGLTPKELLDHHIDISGKMRLLHLMMPILKSAGLRVLIFSQETRQLDILERYMTQSHGSDSYERLDTDIAVNVKEAAIQRFNAEGSKRFVLLLKTGIHVSFRNVQFVLIFDSDWNNCKLHCSL